MTTPQAPPEPASGAYTGPAEAWNMQGNTGTYVGVPDAYRVQQGYVNDPAMAAHYGTKQAFVGVYGVPQYRYSDIDALWGKPKGQVFDLQYKLYALGLLPTFIPGTMDMNTQTAAEKAFEVANKNGTTIEQMLNQSNPATGKPLAGGAGPAGSGGVSTSSSSSSSVSTSRQTQRSITLTSREGAMAVLSNALAQELGRQPSQAELTRFTKSLNAAQMANPDVSTSTSTTATQASQSGSSSTSGSHTSSHTSSRSSSNTTGTSINKQGNVDPAYEATQFAKTTAPAERNRFQDSQYFDVIANMIGAK